MNPVKKNKGSAIFIHIAKKNYKKTQGCVAVKKSDLIKILKEIKINIGSAIEISQEQTIGIRGKDQLSGIPRTISISSNEIASAIESQLTEIALTIVSVLDKTPPELAADVIDRGIMVTGGGAMLNFIDKLLLIETGVPIHLSDYPRHVVAKGALLGLNFADSIARSFSYMDEIFSTANE